MGRPVQSSSAQMMGTGLAGGNRMDRESGQLALRSGNLKEGGGWETMKDDFRILKLGDWKNNLAMN